MTSRKPIEEKKRLSSPEREKQIVLAAVEFFAEVGFSGDTRQLARRLGVTQSLIYKHFPNKEALIDRVYEEVYVGRWDPFWEAVIQDRSIPLEQRLVSHYIAYAKAALTRDWVRIFMFSGLRGESINKKYLDMLRARILEPIAIELRQELGLQDVKTLPLKTAEIELVWSINARIFYFGQRRWIFDVPIEDDVQEMIQLTIAHFMAGARELLPKILSNQILSCSRL
ncbi:MAG: TetR/AcrR family transcriptional regulator [Burkholderiales bacterium]|jgi:AcrR family transcriptional regulator|nr:TetR/AcrR family transcriptional regulator [Burkholderiales bacterium]